MRKSLEGKVAVITGASGGIGSACARELHRRGAQVVVTGRAAEALSGLAGELGPRSLAVPMDVADDQSVKEGFADIYARCGSVDVLVNNAGFGLFEAVAEADIASFEQMMNVNYMGTVRCTKAALPSMLSAGMGHIVNIASIAGKLATARSAGYSATKHAVLGFTNALRQELYGTGIAVTAVHPGPVRTAFFNTADPGGTYVRNIQRFMVTPERVAGAAADAVERRKAEVHVPGWMGFGARAAQSLPVAWVNACASRLLRLK